jgi:hypothetical protein
MNDAEKTAALTDITMTERIDRLRQLLKTPASALNDFECIVGQLQEYESIIKALVSPIGVMGWDGHDTFIADMDIRRQPPSELTIRRAFDRLGYIVGLKRMVSPAERTARDYLPKDTPVAATPEERLRILEAQLAEMAESICRQKERL